MRSVRTRRPLESVVARMSRECGVLGVAFSATGTEMGIRDIVSRRDDFAGRRVLCVFFCRHANVRSSS
jgi:hypothetical protein